MYIKQISLLILVLLYLSSCKKQANPPVSEEPKQFFKVNDKTYNISHAVLDKDVIYLQEYILDRDSNMIQIYSGSYAYFNSPGGKTVVNYLDYYRNVLNEDQVHIRLDLHSKTYRNYKSNQNACVFIKDGSSNIIRKEIKNLILYNESNLSDSITVSANLSVANRTDSTSVLTIDNTRHLLTRESSRNLFDGFRWKLHNGNLHTAFITLKSIPTANSTYQFGWYNADDVTSFNLITYKPPFCDEYLNGDWNKGVTARLTRISTGYNIAFDKLWVRSDLTNQSDSIEISASINLDFK